MAAIKPSETSNSARFGSIELIALQHKRWRTASPGKHKFASLCPARRVARTMRRASGKWRRQCERAAADPAGRPTTPATMEFRCPGVRERATKRRALPISFSCPGCHRLRRSSVWMKNKKNKTHRRTRCWVFVVATPCKRTLGAAGLFGNKWAGAARSVRLRISSGAAPIRPGKRGAERRRARLAPLFNTCNNSYSFPVGHVRRFGDADNRRWQSRAWHCVSFFKRFSS